MGRWPYCPLHIIVPSDLARSFGAICACYCYHVIHRVITYMHAWSESMQENNSRLTKLFGGLSYEKIRRYNNVPLYVTARWLPQQIPHFTFPCLDSILLSQTKASQFTHILYWSKFMEMVNLCLHRVSSQQQGGHKQCTILIYRPILFVNVYSIMFECACFAWERVMNGMTNSTCLWEFLSNFFPTKFIDWFDWNVQIYVHVLFMWI